MRVLDYERPLHEAGAVFIGTQKQGRELHRTGAWTEMLKKNCFCVTVVLLYV